MCCLHVETMSSGPTVLIETAAGYGKKRPFVRRQRPQTKEVARDVVLDPQDAGIEAAIVRLERKSFIRDGVIPEIQCLLRVPAPDAKQIYLSALSQYSLACMLIMASLLGSALNPLEPDSYPESAPRLVASFNMLSVIVCCACLFGTVTFLLEAIIMEGTPADRVHGIIAQSDPIFHFGTCMVAVGLQGTLPLLLMRAWISGLDQTQCAVLTVVCTGLYSRMMYVYLRHLQTHWPVEAQRWTKLFLPPLYRRELSHAAIDELVAELRYLQQPREKAVTLPQLSGCLEAYFGKSGSSSSGGGSGVVAGTVVEGDGGGEGSGLAAFLQLVEAEAGGRLAPTAEKLATKAFERALEASLEKLADEAVGLVAELGSRI